MENQLVNFNLAEKQALTELHILPSDYGDEDFFEMQEILSTTEEDKRVDPSEQFNRIIQQQQHN